MSFKSRLNAADLVKSSPLNTLEEPFEGSKNVEEPVTAIRSIFESCSTSLMRNTSPRVI